MKHKLHPMAQTVATEIDQHTVRQQVSQVWIRMALTVATKIDQHTVRQQVSRVWIRMAQTVATEIDQHTAQGNPAMLYKSELQAYVLRQVENAGDLLAAIIDAEAGRPHEHETARFLLDDILHDLKQILAGAITAQDTDLFCANCGEYISLHNDDSPNACTYKNWQ